MIRLLITTIILFFGASKTFAQTPDVLKYYCLHTDRTTYMKVVISGGYNDEKLFAYITSLDKDEVQTFARAAVFAASKGNYTYFQTDLKQQGGIWQATYAVPNDGSHIYVTLAYVDAEYHKDEAEIETITYLCKDTPFD